MIDALQPMLRTERSIATWDRVADRGRSSPDAARPSIYLDSISIILGTTAVLGVVALLVPEPRVLGEWTCAESMTRNHTNHMVTADARFPQAALAPSPIAQSSGTDMSTGCDIEDLKPGTRILCGEERHGVVLFNNTCGYYTAEYPQESWGYLGDGFMAEYIEAGLVYQEDTSEIELADPSSGPGSPRTT
jgi:hypothetical protein